MKNKLRGPLWLIAVCLFMVWAVFGYKYQFTYNKGNSMEPTFSDGDWIIIQKKNRLPKSWKPERYDAIVIADEKTGENLSKRIIGISGDKIEIKEGHIYLNNNKLKGPYGHGRIFVQLVDENDKDLHYWGTDERVIRYIDQEAAMIPEGCVWVIGDDREISWYGILPIKDIKGLIIL